MKHFLLIGLSLCYAFSAMAAPQMKVVPPVVSYGERVQLILSDDNPIQNTPDLSSLQKDFTIRGQQQMESTSIINGVRTETHQLILSLFPRQKGTLTIGPFDWNGTQLPAVQVQVTDGALPNTNPAQQTGTMPANTMNATQAPTNRIFSAEAQLQANEIYEGETTLYTVRLTENIGLSQAQIQTPESNQYTLTVFERDKMSKTTVQGQPARAFERSFLLTPNATGTIQIAGGGVLGLVPDTTARRPRAFNAFADMFDTDDFFNQPFGMPQKEIYAGTNSVTLTVKPKPANWNGWWLPSRQVKLNEQYKMPNNVQVGQPIERYVQLSALGVDGNKLPLIVQPVNQAVKAYANPEKRTIIPSENGIIGYEEIMFVIVPTQSGEVTVPAIRIEWFNTQTKQKEIAELPAKIIQVAPADNAATIPTETNNAVTPQSVSNETESVITPPQPTLTTNNPSQNTTAQTSDTAFWHAIKRIWTAFGLFELVMVCVVLGFFIGLTYLIRRRKKSHFLYQEQSTKVKDKNKKPLPDLYPFK